MKKTFFPVALCLFLFSCKQENTAVSDHAAQLKTETNAAATASRFPKEDYQAFPPQIRFVTGTDHKPMDLEGQKAFIQSSGLPLEPAFYNWTATHTPAEAIALFKEHLEKYPDHPYLNVFRQYEAWLLLTRYNMLSTNPNHPFHSETVNYLVAQLIHSKYTGYQLLAYALEQLKSRQAATTEALSVYARQIVADAGPATPAGNSRPLTQNDLQPSGKPLPPGALEMINQHLAQKAAQGTYLQQIRSHIIR